MCALSDSVLTLGAQVRPVLLAAYAIAKSVAAVDPKLRAKLAPVIDYYSRIGRRGAQTRQAADRLRSPAPPLTMKRLLELAPPEKLQELKDSLSRDAAVDAAAIRAWRGSQHRNPSLGID